MLFFYYLRRRLTCTFLSPIENQCYESFSARLRCFFRIPNFLPIGVVEDSNLIFFRFHDAELYADMLELISQLFYQINSCPQTQKVNMFAMLFLVLILEHVMSIFKSLIYCLSLPNLPLRRKIPKFLLRSIFSVATVASDHPLQSGHSARS